MSEPDHAGLITAAHRYLAAPVIALQTLWEPEMGANVFGRPRT
jgi:hypothetical protein